jgi:transcriptional antiterminator RfaH
MTEKWYCGYTHPWQEFRARSSLEEAKFTVLLPTYTPERKDYEQPLFPRYIFIRFDVERDHWQRAWYAPGVRSILNATPETPLPIADAAVDLVIQQVEFELQAADHKRTAAAAPIPVGSKVRIRQKGSLVEHNLAGICRWSTRRRVAVLVEMMGKDVQVVVDRNEVEVGDG